MKTLYYVVGSVVLNRIITKVPQYYTSSNGLKVSIVKCFIDVKLKIILINNSSVWMITRVFDSNPLRLGSRVERTKRLYKIFPC